MATSDVTVVCGVCEAQHVTKPADHWCSECEEGLCDDCLKFHKASKSSRHHGVISVNDYKQLPSSVSSIAQYCQEHDRKYQNYCPQHQSLCCPICIANDHKDCVRIQALEEILKTAKTSTLLDSLVQSLTGIKTNLNNIITDRKQNLGKIKEQREEIQSDIELTREKLNKQLDVLQQNLLTVLTTNAQTVTSEIEMLVKRLEERVRHVDDLQHRILAVKQYASDLQAFLGSKSVETEVEKEEKYIHSLMTDGSLQQVELICKLDETLLSRLSNAKSFGTMTLDKRPSSVSINTEKEKQAQILTSAVTKTEKLCLEQIMKSNVPIGEGESISITGCTISPSGKFILADGVRNKRLLILNENGTLDKEISLSPNKPYDVACLDETLVAVTCWCERQIFFVNTVTKITERTINTTNPCDGIAGIQGTLVCCERSQGIRMIKVEDGSSSYVFKENIHEKTFVAISGDHVYHTNRNNNTVTCYKLSGEKAWEFNDDSLPRPFGVTVDNSSNVYVASPEYNSVGVISSDGKFCRQLLTKKDGIYKAYAIHFDRKTNKLLVTNYYGTVLLYKVS